MSSHRANNERGWMRAQNGSLSPLNLSQKWCAITFCHMQLPTELCSYWSCNKLLQALWLKTAQIYYLKVLYDGHPVPSPWAKNQGVQEVYIPFWKLWRRNCFLTFSSFYRSLHFLICCCFFHLQSQQWQLCPFHISLTFCLLFFYFSGSILLHLAHLDNLGQSPHLTFNWLASLIASATLWGNILPS